MNPQTNEKRFSISGTVTLTGNRPAAGIHVTVFNKNIRSLAELGNTVTGKQGEFYISYPSQFQEPEYRAADIVFRLSAPEGKEIKGFDLYKKIRTKREAVAEPKIIFNAAENEQVEIVLTEAEEYKGLSQFEEIAITLQPLLREVPAEELSENEKHQDISFVAGETGIDKEQVSKFAIAHRLALKSGIKAEFWFALFTASFYNNLFERSRSEDPVRRMSIVISTLSSVTLNTVRKTITDAIQTNIISKRFERELESWIRLFSAFVKYQLGSQQQDEGQNNIVKQVLQVSGLNDEYKSRFLDAYLQHDGSMDELWKKLEEQQFPREELHKLDASFQLTDLVRNNFSVAKAASGRFQVSSPDQLKQLARMSEQQWEDFIKKEYDAGNISIPEEIIGDKPERKITSYSRMVANNFKEAFPTSSFLGGLERSLQDQERPAIKNPEAVQHLLTTDTNFDLLSTNIDNYLKETRSPGSREINNNEDFRLGLKAVQRVFKLAPDFEATNTLLKDDIHSAAMIYRSGKTAFVKKYEHQKGFTTKSATDTWNMAANTHAAVVTLVGELKALESSGELNSFQPTEEAFKKFPNWPTLFGKADICECEHCRSVYSPAAYLADLLMFLKNRVTGIEAPFNNAKEVVFNRRADLGYLELSCENANTPLPYIDIVNEILEAVVAAGEDDVELAGLSVLSSDPGTARTEVQTAFQTAGIVLSDDFILSPVPGKDEFMVRDTLVTYLLKKKLTPNYFYEITRQTKVSAEELRANPQFIKPKAYEKLSGIVYPWVLPYNLFTEETSLLLEKAGVKRWQLMEGFRGVAIPNNPAEEEIAAAYFNLSYKQGSPQRDEGAVLLIADTVSQFEYWGEASNVAMLAKLKKVDVFLQRTGLEYNDMLTLFDLAYINPDKDIFIEHLDVSCDTDKKEIKNLDENKMDRIRRFILLWKKLKWKMWEVDLVINNPKIGAGDITETFLVNLLHFTELKNKLGRVSVEELSALFTNINTTTRFKALHEPRTDALYQTLFLNKKITGSIDEAFDVANVDVANSAELISNHLPAVLGALKIKEKDLLALVSLTKPSDNTLYITDELTLGNLSFLYRHALLAKLLKYKTNDWMTVLNLLNTDLQSFNTTKEALDTVRKIEQLKTTGFKLDELNYILSADMASKAALKEKELTKFLIELRKGLKDIITEYDKNEPKYSFLQTIPATGIATNILEELFSSLLQKLNFDQDTSNRILGIFRGDLVTQKKVASLPNNFAPLEAIAVDGFSYDAANKILRFTGVMTNTQRNTLLTDASLAAITGNLDYQAAIAALFETPGMLIKFFELGFTAPLENLPPVIDFKQQLDAALAYKVYYQTEERELHFTGIMSTEERDELFTLSADVAYQNAVNSLYTQPRVVLPEWMAETDLAFPLRDLVVPANDNQNKNMVTAVVKILDYLKSTLSDKWVIQKFSELTALRPATVTRLFEAQLLPPATTTVLQYFTGAFASGNSTIDSTDVQYTDAYNQGYWSHRVAMVINKLKLDLEEVEWLADFHGTITGIDFETLPMTISRPDQLNELLTTVIIFKLHHRFSNENTTFLSILEKLNAVGYLNTDFAIDVNLLTEWETKDIETFTTILDINYPADYLKAETWARLGANFEILGKLGGAADTVKQFANPLLTLNESVTIKQLLRSLYDTEAWLELSTDVQDKLRERKRDALVAYLLTQPMPADAPSGKWENANDLYSYYLADVEMASCQLTSRMVQGSGSIQLFVQRCFMGLEPNVKVDTTNDSAWKWWKWMKNYRVWEANRKVFLYPENWIEPELRIDRSSFFKDLENELLQNEVNRDTVESAFLSYLDKLDSVARLEIAGTYHEDDGDKTIFHVFAKTPSTKPHTYYYRKWDYRRWSPWEKVDLDIAEDYLIPVIINKRLYLFWPVFNEIPADQENKEVDIPQQNSANQKLPPAKKILQLQLAVSEFRNKKWSPKKVSEPAIFSFPYESEIKKETFRFLPIDQTTVDGRFVIYVEADNFAKFTNPYGYYLDMSGAANFELLGCKGIPEIAPPGYPDKYQSVVLVKESATFFAKEKENKGRIQNDFTFLLNGEFAGNNYLPSNDAAYSSALLIETPGLFRAAMPKQVSYFDKLFQDVCHNQQLEMICPFGLWLPFFFADKEKTFFTMPVFAPYDRRKAPSFRLYYPDLKKGFLTLENMFDKWIEEIIEQLEDILPALPAAQRQAVEQFLADYFDTNPPFTDEQILDFYRIIFKQYANFLLGVQAMHLHQFRRYHFKNFYHPFTCYFAKQIYTKGIDGLMNRDTQLKDTGFSFRDMYKPTFNVLDPVPTPKGLFEFYPKEDVDFTPDGSYSSYNWELFYHAPLMIASRLSKNQRFEEAMDWFHYIFNPLDASKETAPQKFWVTKPFFLLQKEDYVKQRIENIMRMLAGDTTTEGFSNELKNELEKQVLDWKDHPFDPHIIAQFRIVAYQKTAVIKYLDNLIAWGDQLFRRDTMESINEATQLYILAAEILGPRPRKVPPRVKPPVESFNELEPDFDSFSNALVNIENLIPPLPPGDDDDGEKGPVPEFLYFCIPQNEKLLEYWDVVADRLFKIRHCMNIEGVVRQLALFEPPIDPGMLVKAVAAGIDISSVLADVNSPMPFYRFNILLQKAAEICNELKSLGSSLLSALEKKDGEEMALLRQNQEIQMLEVVTTVKKYQLDEAKENLESLKKTKITTETRRDYYRDIKKIIQGEQLSMDMQKKANQHQQTAQSINIGASVLGYIPNITIGTAGFGGSPEVNTQWGTNNIISALQASSGAETNLSSKASYEATTALTNAGYERRFDDWKLQEKLALKELDQIEKQILGADIRIKIAEKELDNHVLQIENAKAVKEFMESKYTNKELYEWMITQTSQVYFQSYQLAYDLAKKAERCYRYELGLDDSNFIQFGYWDSLKKGLLTGEKLSFDLKRLEASYLDLNRREYELTKHISLSELNPEALLILKNKGKCFVSLPEAIFDLDYAGHYMRRIKSISITIPCITGAYTTISCSLRLIKSSIRKKNTLLNGKYERDPDETTENRFKDNYGTVQSIATSHAQTDSGLFELNFKDDRYLPFEGCGAISEWQIEMPSDFRQFDYDTISDIIIHMKYTSREAGKALGDQAMVEMTEKLNALYDDKGLFHLFSLKNDFPDAYHQLLKGPVNPQTTEFDIKANYFPYMFKGKDLEMTEVKIFLLPKEGQTITTAGLNLDINGELPAGAWSNFKQTEIKLATYDSLTDDPLKLWTINSGNNGLKKEEVDDMLIMIRYIIL